MVVAAPRWRVGTSGWAYRHWRGRFYPPDLPTRDWLGYYATRFPAVEVNASFYRLPRPETAAAWAASTPPGFAFAAKGSRWITHRLRLQGVGDAVARFWAALEPLGDKWQRVLWQLPPSLPADPARLDAFLAQLPAWPPSAFEFRHPSWEESPAVAEVLARHDAVFCRAVTPAHPDPPPEPPGPAPYLRFHGVGGWYRGRYGLPRLQAWARWLRRGNPADGSAWVFFNNDADAAAVADASDLLAALNAAAAP